MTTSVVGNLEKTSRRVAVLERDKPTFELFETLESGHNDEFVQRCGKAHERRSRGDMRPRLEGRNPRRGKKAARGSAGGIRVKPLRHERTVQMRESLSFAALE
jgi:hypothetical protein